MKKAQQDQMSALTQPKQNLQTGSSSFLDDWLAKRQQIVAESKMKDDSASAKKPENNDTKKSVEKQTDYNHLHIRENGSNDEVSIKLR